MQHFHRRWFSGPVVLLAPAGLLLAAQQRDTLASSPRNPIKGSGIFRQYCASCHESAWQS